MHFRYVGANDAFRDLVWQLENARQDPEGKFGNWPPVSIAPSRDGEVITIEEPVTITYEKPTERVLFNVARDCNPFFHLYEALWMLAGRNDLPPLVYYNSGMARFTDDGGKTQPGAYGHRWREYFGYDQLDWIVESLRANPFDRRIVLQMWDPGRVRDNGGPDEGSGDFYKAGHGGTDVPCNTEAFFRSRSIKMSRSEARKQNLKYRIGADGNPDPDGVCYVDYLDMTVINRSNDLAWGALGANVVHFSFLQEYLAARCGVEVGQYHQISNNLHAYTARWEPDKWVSDTTPVVYDREEWNAVPLVKNPLWFDPECGELVKWADFSRREDVTGLLKLNLSEPFLQHVARPALAAFYYHKQRDYEGAQTLLGDVLADDWRETCLAWVLRRRDMWEAKQRGEAVSDS
jgi:thymidylate synthase